MQQARLQRIHRMLPRPMIDLLKIDALVRTREIGQRKPSGRNPTECDERDVAAAHCPLTKDFETMVWWLRVEISSIARRDDTQTYAPMCLQKGLSYLCVARRCDTLCP